MPMLRKFSALLDRTIPYMYPPPSPGTADEAAAGASLIFTCRSSLRRRLPFRAGRSTLAGIRFPRSHRSLDLPGSSKGCAHRSVLGFIAPSLRRNRKQQIDYRPLAYGASHANPAGVILENPFHDPQAEARSLPALGGHKRLKHRFLDLRADAAARIGHGETDPAAESIAGTDFARTDHQLAARSHAVARIDHQIR